MRRVLIVSYFAPPQPEAAALRVSYLMQYLPRFGWEPVLVTRAYPGAQELPFRLIQTGTAPRPYAASRPSNLMKQMSRKFRFTRYATGLFRSLVYFPDASVTWLWPAIRQSLRLTKREKFDALLTTYGPATEHIIGFVIARLRHVPWVADYRDLWQGNALRRWGPIHRGLEARLEKFVVARADELTAVAGIADHLRTIHRRRVVLIPNGYDDAIWKDIPDLEPQEFLFCYAGRTYGGSRSPELLFSAIAKMRARGEQSGLAARFVFFGPDCEFISDLAFRYGLSSSVDVRGYVERSEALKAERNSAVLLIMVGSFPGVTSMEGSKIFEYAGAGRPILALGPSESVVRGMLAESGLGQLVSTDAECASAVQALYERFKAKNFVPQRNPMWQPWRALDLAKRFAEVLDSVVSSRSRG